MLNKNARFATTSQMLIKSKKYINPIYYKASALNAILKDASTVNSQINASNVLLIPIMACLGLPI